MTIGRSRANRSDTVLASGATTRSIAIVGASVAGTSVDTTSVVAGSVAGASVEGLVDFSSPHATIIDNDEIMRRTAT